MSVTTVTIAAACPGCGTVVPWYGTCAEPGGATAYVIHCHRASCRWPVTTLEGEPK